MKDLINIIELIVIAKVLWNIVRFLRGKKKHKTLLGKVWLLISKQLHSSIDSRLREQNKRLAENRQAYDNVISLHARRKIN